jgi:hypothetical protein
MKVAVTAPSLPATGLNSTSAPPMLPEKSLFPRASRWLCLVTMPRCTVKLIQPVAMEEGLRFAIREGGKTVGAGAITKIIK